MSRGELLINVVAMHKFINEPSCTESDCGWLLAQAMDLLDEALKLIYELEKK